AGAGWLSSKELLASPRENAGADAHLPRRKRKTSEARGGRSSITRQAYRCKRYSCSRTRRASTESFSKHSTRLPRSRKHPSLLKRKGQLGSRRAPSRWV